MLIKYYGNPTFRKSKKQKIIFIIYMPYKIVEATKNNKIVGYYVKDVKGKKFSNKPISYNNAVKQRQAIAISESKLTGKPVSYYFL